MGVLLKSYMGVWKRQLFGLVKRFCVSLEAYISVSKRLYMAVSTHTYDDVLTHLHMCVLQRRPLIVAERRLYAHRKPGFRCYLEKEYVGSSGRYGLSTYPFVVTALHTVTGAPQNEIGKGLSKLTGFIRY